MKLWAGLARWASRSRQAPEDRTPDPADMGTAFGLDASFAQVAESERVAMPRSRPLRPTELRLVRRPQR